MRSKYQISLTISSLAFITISVSAGVLALNSSNSPKLDVNEPVQRRNGRDADELRVSIEYYNRRVMNGSKNFCCSSLKEVVLNTDTAEPSLFTHPVFSECREVIKRIKAFDLTDSQLEVYQNPFSDLPHLEELMIYNLHIGRLTKDFFTGLPELELLEVAGSIEKIDPDAFTGMPNLNCLELRYITLEESHLESLKSLPNLERLVIIGANISNINALKGFPRLKDLILTDNSISKFNITELKENLPSLEVVDLIGNPLDPEFEKELKKDMMFIGPSSWVPVPYNGN